MVTSWAQDWWKSQELRGPSVKNAPTFYRNIEEALDVKRKTHRLYAIRTTPWKEGVAVDFSSNDTLSLGSTGLLRAEFNKELDRHPDVPIGSTGTRIADGNSTYLEEAEAEIARFHGAETGLLTTSGFEANLAVFTAIPRPGDVIVYDDLVHASMHDGMERSAGVKRYPFQHNDLESFRDVLEEVQSSHDLISSGKRNVLVAIESIYSMDGDICPLRELIDVAQQVLHGGNVQFTIEEAHSTGVLGSTGGGLVNELGLEKAIAVRVHTYGKAMGSTGAIILGNSTVKAALLNFARSVIYTTAPSFPQAAMIKASYNLQLCDEIVAARAKVQHLVKYFFAKIDTHKIWNTAIERGIVDVPISEGWRDRTVHSHIIPICTERAYWLVFHLLSADICAFPVEYPTVPKGKGRVRLSFHAGNDEAQIDRLVDVVGEWIEEMIAIEDGTSVESMPSAALKVYRMNA